MQFNPEQFGQAMADVVKKAVAPLQKEIAGLKAQLKELSLVEPKNGKDGADGKDGVDGKSLTADDVKPLIKELLEQQIAKIPTPKDGVDGKDGRDGADGRDGIDGKDAEPISEAAVADSVAAKFERRFSDLILSWERQARDEIGKAIDKMPAPKDGIDGKNAVPIESLEIIQNERDITIKLGDVERKIKLDTILDRGVWEKGLYEKGDAVTYGGSLWIAQEKTEDAPGTNKTWRLAVKKGRDGRDLRENASAHDKTKGVTV